MLAYVICCKKFSDYLKLLVELSEKNLKYEPDQEKLLIYINEAEAVRDKLSSITEYLVPRRCYLRIVSCELIPETKKLVYGELGSAPSTGTKGLLRKLKNTYHVNIMKGLIWYPGRQRIWHRSIGYCDLSQLKDPSTTLDPERREILDTLSSLMTI